MTDQMLQAYTVSFPFGVTDMIVSFNGVKRSIQERSYVFTVNPPLPGTSLPYSAALNAYFVYLPALAPGAPAELTVPIGTESPVTSFSLRRWSKKAPEVADAFSDFTITAKGVAGEECREYLVEYSFDTSPPLRGW